jgi:hypothetical protein
MAQRPGFDMNKLSPADKILGVAGLLFFIDTFLAWQRACADLGVLGGKFCASASAWGGDGGFLGVLAALASILLVAWIVVQAAGMAVQINVPANTLTLGLAGATILFGLIKFLVVIGQSGGYGAWIGLILLIGLGYGAFMKWQEKAAMPPTMAPPPPPPPAPPPMG